MVAPSRRTIAGLPLAVALALALPCACRRSAPACNTLVNEAQRISFTVAEGALPAMAGGRIADGVYQATRAEGFGSAAPSGRRMTLEIRDGGTRFAWAGDLLDAGAANVTAAIRVNATVSASGNRLDVTTTCSSVSPSPLPTTLTFSASPGKIVLAFVEGAGASVTTYLRRD